MKKSICIISQSHLSKNPRVLKEAIAIEALGYRVDIANSIFSEKLQMQDLKLIEGLNIKIHPISDLRTKNFLSLYDKLIRKISTYLISKFKIENSSALGYGVERYLDYCKKLDADLYIGHQEVGLYVGTQLLKRNYNVAFDFEDWYAEDLLPKDRKSRPIRLLAALEHYALKHASVSLTTSKILAEALSARYAVNAPNVIYNVFENEEVTFQKKEFSQPLKLTWFSQTIGEGRGLEEFINLLLNVKTQVELHLLGEINVHYQNQLVDLAKGKFSIQFHPIVEPNELVRKLASFDIGLALEKNSPLSRNFTVTNKFFQYLHAGLPIICSNTKGQEELFNLYKPGLMLNDDKTAAQNLEDFFSDQHTLRHAKEMALKTAEKFNWANEKIKLLTYLDLS